MRPRQVKFSIITAAWRLPGTLKAIECIENQTLTDWEHIIVNDDSIEIRQYFQNRELGKKRYFCDMGKRMHGFGSYARNVGVNYASGEYILFLDDDNLWTPEHLENIAKCIGENPEVKMVGVYTEIRGKIDPNYRHILRTRVAPQQCDLGSFAYHRDMFRKYGYFECRPERRVTFDFELINHIYEGGEKFIIIPKPTFIYYHSRR